MKRPRYVDPNDTRSPMHRFLEDAATPDGRVFPTYDAQWRTLWKAQRLGYVDGHNNITAAGRIAISLYRKGAK